MDPTTAFLYGDDSAEVAHAEVAHTKAQDKNAPKAQKRKEPPTTEDSEVHKAQKVIENRAIWVTNVPLDATFEELYDTFKRYGIIDVSIDKTPRIKMYTGEDGNFNGEVLVVYFKPESVDIAIDMLDDYALRPGKEATEGKLKVEPSDNTRRKNANTNEIKLNMPRKDRKQADRNRAELNRQVAEWSDNEEEVREITAPKKNKWAKNAIIFNAFRPFELEDDPDMYNEVRDDMMEVAEQFGTVSKLTICDLEPRGIVVVRFRTIEAAEKFQESHINGRFYNMRQLRIELAEDRPKYRKSSGKDHKVNPSGSEEPDSKPIHSDGEGHKDNDADSDDN